MKPTIQAWAGTWFCELDGTKSGIGNPPMDAYENWIDVNGGWDE